MVSIIKITLKGIFRDKIFQGIMLLAALLFFIPSVSTLSMRQVTELSITLSLSLISFILLLLSVFLGATTLWKDIERRYTFSVLSLPVSRTEYLLGRFCGVSLFLFLTTFVLGIIACAVIKMSASAYPSTAGQPLIWWYIIIAIFASTLKYILLVAVALLLSTVSTSFFLPIFGTICVYFTSSITQQVYEFVRSPASIKTIIPVVKYVAIAAYYIMPNFAGFDLKINAIYGVVPDIDGLLLTFFYFVSYTTIILGGAAFVFERREMK